MEQRGWTLVVPVSTDHAYARLTDFGRMSEYPSGIETVRRQGDDRLRVSGTSGDWVWRITEAQPGRALVLEPLDAAGPALRFMLEPGDHGTSVTVRATHTDPAPPLEPDRDRLRAFLQEHPGAG